MNQSSSKLISLKKNKEMCCLRRIVMASIHVVWIVTVEDGRVKHGAGVADFHEATLVGTQVELSTVVRISVMAV